MSVRFVIGRAGCGKTHHCVEAVRARLREDALEGPRLILLVPEQASQQMERAVLLPRRWQGGVAEISAAHRAEVLSFQRLAFRVVESMGTAVRPALSDAARAMVVRHLMTRVADRLRYFRRPGRLAGLVQRLSGTLTEFIQEAIAPDEMSLGAAAHGDSIPSTKLHDLSVLHSAYLEYLKAGFVDPSQYLGVARESLARCDWLTGAELWVDGFASLSGEEIRTLVALAGLAARTEVTILLDARAVRSDCDPPTTTLFAKSLRTYRELREGFAAAGLVLEEPLLLQPPTPPRFTCGGLAALERNWGANAGASGAVEPDDVELIGLPSRRLEVEYAVYRVLEWVQARSGSLRYRDVAIIARNLEPYHELLAASLTARGVPFFMDRRRSVAHHPLVELVRSVIQTASDAMSLDAMRLLLKTGMLPLRAEQADELENYILGHGIAGANLWLGPDWSFRRHEKFSSGEETRQAGTQPLARVNLARRQVVQSLDRWWTFAGHERGHTGKPWAAEITGLLERLGAASTLLSWSQAAEADGRLDEADEHRQVWSSVLSLVDDLAFAFRDTALTIAELGEVLESGMSGLTLGLVPPTVDQVLVGAIERSRHPDIKAAVLIGFNDGLFPQPPNEDPILNDDDRKALRDAGVRIAQPARERVLDESMLAYIALTRASHALVVTYAGSDDQGKALGASPYTQTLLAACPGLRVRTVADPARQRALWDISSADDLRRRLTLEFRSRPARGRDAPALRGRWNELYDVARRRLAQQAVSRNALRSLADRIPARLSRQSVERLFPQPLATSVSRLETYAACPFQFFARYALRLCEREDAGLRAVDIGRLQHSILEDFAAGVTTRSGGLAELSENQLMDGLNESCGRVLNNLATDGLLGEPRNAYLLRRSASHLAGILEVQRRIAQSGRTRAAAAELAFGTGQPGSLPPLDIVVSEKRRALLRGVIDRIDLAELAGELLGVVIDYKRTPDKALDLTEVYHGLSLQLISYLLVLAEHGHVLAGRDVSPIAALFVSLTPRYSTAEHPDDVSQRMQARGGAYIPRGILRGDKLGALDTTQGTGWLMHYHVRLAKNGALVEIDKSDGAESADFARLLDHTRAKLVELINRLLDGDIAAYPYRLNNFRPCVFCAMAGVCRFEMGRDPLRFLDPLKRSEVFRRLQDLPPSTSPS
jgi:ATP-dependent helicase/nuclease subunit B